jgi:hypothetical protein
MWMVFEKMVLKRLLGFKGKEVTEVWRMLHSKERYDFGAIGVIK